MKGVKSFKQQKHEQSMKEISKNAKQRREKTKDYENYPSAKYTEKQDASTRN